MNDDFDYSALTEYGDDEPSGAFYGKVNPYDGRNFYVTLRLSDLYNAVITEHDYEEATATWSFRPVQGCWADRDA